ncbi:MAG: sugar phosphate nucleotidyltransferase [bacterium]
MKSPVAVIPVAGQGTRMYPLSRAIKKEFLPLIDPDGQIRPLIHLLVKEAVDSGVERVCIVVQPDHRVLFEDYFHGNAASDPGAARFPDAAEEIEKIGHRVVFAEQSHQWGFGHAVWSSLVAVGQQPVLTMLGDHAFASRTSRRCVRQLLDTAESVAGSLSGVIRTPEEELQYFGTVRGRAVSNRPGLYETEEIVEKPSLEVARARLRTPGDSQRPYLCWFGMHLLSPTVLDCLDYMVRHREENTEVGLTEAQEMTREREGYWVMDIDGIRFDLGVPHSYRHSVTNWPGAVAAGW